MRKIHCWRLGQSHQISELQGELGLSFDKFISHASPLLAE